MSDPLIDLGPYEALAAKTVELIEAAASLFPEKYAGWGEAGAQAVRAVFDRLFSHGDATKFAASPPLTCAAVHAAVDDELAAPATFGAAPGSGVPPWLGELLKAVLPALLKLL